MTPVTTVAELFALYRAPGPPHPVKGVTHDSRRVQPGFVYVALRGQRCDGHRFIPDAVQRGAVAIVGEEPLEPGVPYLRVPDARRALSRLAAAFYGFPSTRLFVIGVTGTDGKTTTSCLVHHLLTRTGRGAGLISTVGLRYGEETRLLEGHFTTPEAPEVQAALAEMVRRGLTHAVLETSSHALAQHRVADVAYDLAVWTNLSPEHLDFHGSLEAYFQAKAALVNRAGFSILNAGCPYAMRLTHRPHTTYGVQAGAYRAVRVRESTDGLRFTLEAPGFTGEAFLPMIGRYNVENALAALAAAHRAGVPLEEALPALARFSGVPGRMQILQAHPIRAVVDFAHTPKALAKALTALRPTTPGRLIVVIGAAGERDPAKRAPLGRTAVTLADFAVFTEEDARSEDVHAILQEMERGAREAGGVRGTHYALKPDRRDAIRYALSLARPGDTVVFAGKGHERTLERADETLPWDEAEEVRKALGIAID
ncbi:UDP-N-acetylmuramoyl-L-alanyl-D-glutamate--2,6-diaminopimelate ligase [Marinithermus hydrothermalis]|uniref:UDP-N-acetylmuramyl-tripeptide synthetase n=1 Tax=Marinithermus hydrothermalis (strain DSM 14884 / JCM 11576 / T1) TaxID=869210 RepID=F2NM36_MARHT|nr:UDP-N-acetylmuramoyl-L-alanyl-D-glutamate--2,6-diaminopimelate ligase [Marinithermus hydrothermalis DSM 14884]